MKFFGFEVAHNYKILTGYITAENKVQAIKMIENEEWDDILDEYDIDECIEGYEVTDIWEVK